MLHRSPGKRPPPGARCRQQGLLCTTASALALSPPPPVLERSGRIGGVSLDRCLESLPRCCCCCGWPSSTAKPPLHHPPRSRSPAIGSFIIPSRPALCIVKDRHCPLASAVGISPLREADRSLRAFIILHLSHRAAAAIFSAHHLVVVVAAAPHLVRIPRIASAPGHFVSPSLLVFSRDFPPRPSVALMAP